MKKIIIGLGILAAIVFIAFSISEPKPSGPERTSDTTSAEGVEFMERLSAITRSKGGQPIHGFDAKIYLNLFPGLTKADFNDVETEGGRLVYANDTLTFVRSENQLITSAEETISQAGYAALLSNLRNRLDKDASIDEIISLVFGGESLGGGDTGMMMVGNNALNVNEQMLGDKVVVSLAVLEKNGYVVVHRMEDGKPGKIIGTSVLLASGKTSNADVALTEVLQEGKSYIAMLHFDDGDGIFGADMDFPVLGSGTDTSPIMMEFQTGANADGGAISI